VQISILVAVFFFLFAAGIVQDPSVKPSVWTGVWGDMDSAVTRSLGLMVGSTLLFWSAVRLTAQMLLKRMQRLGWENRRAMRLPGRIDLVVQTLLLALFAAQITVGGWTRVVLQNWELGNSILIWEICLIVPFIILMIIKWTCYYPINRFIRMHIVVEQLTDSISVRPVWKLGHYLSFQLRHGLLIILIPLLLIFAFRDTVEWASCRFWQERMSPVQIELITLVGVAIIFLVAPLLLRFIWSTRSLPEGPLRERLTLFCKRLDMRYQDILLWETHNAVANAAVMGLLWPVRFVLLSDALIENMDDEQIEAVFGHEAGHVKHHHILFLVLFVFASGSVIVGTMEFFTRFTGSNEFLFTYQDSIVLTSSALLGLGWVALFGWVSRRYERQADLHAAMSIEMMDSEGGEKSEESPPDITLGPRGAAVVGSALERIAILNGISIHSRSWRHSSIASRVAFVKKLAQEPRALKRFNRTVTLIKISTIGVLVTTIVCGWLTFKG
jgi:STE24 endopeptidase